MKKLVLSMFSLIMLFSASPAGALTIDEAIEILPELGEEARRRLERLGYTNVEVHAGDGSKGLPERAPFDGILVAAAPARIPEALLDQLKVGARLVIPVGVDLQDLWVVMRTEEGFDLQVVCGVRFVPMIGENNG